MLNVLNAGLSVVFVLGFDLGVAGVGAASAVAQWLHLLAATVIIVLILRQRGAAPARGLLDSAAIRRLFAAPNELVLGHETAAAALARFEQAVKVAIDDAPDPNVVIVSHGTVISLLVARRSGLDPMELWMGLTTPCYLVLELPSFNLLDIVSDIT